MLTDEQKDIWASHECVASEGQEDEEGARNGKKYEFVNCNRDEEEDGNEVGDACAAFRDEMKTG